MPEWERRFRDLYQTLREQINAAIDDDNTRLMPADLVVLKNSPARQMVEAAFSEHGDTPEVLAMRVAVKIGNHGEVYKQADKLLEKSSRPDLAETKKTA